MNHKERVITALNHEEPDRVPVDCGGRNTTLMIEGYEKLKTKLGMEHLETEVMSKVWQTAYIHESIQELFHGDCRHIRPINVTVPQNEANELNESGEEIFVDQWGVKRRVENGYASISEYITPEASMEVLENFSWPDPAKDMDYSRVKKEAKNLHDEGKYAIVGSMGTPGNLFEQCWCLRGMPEFFMDMAGNKDFAHALLRKILDIRKENARLFLEEAGDYLDVFQLADDLAMQNGPFMSEQCPITQALMAGDSATLTTLIQGDLDHGIPASSILNDILIPGMDVVGGEMESGDMFIPEVLMCAKAMGQAVEILIPLLADGESSSAGKVVIGTVKGDLHDIGKNLVSMMMESAGFEVVDLGVDVEAVRFVAAVKEQKADILGLSALLTTTMPKLRETIDAFIESGLRDQVKIIVGGAPVTQSFADEIGADGYAADAGSASKIAKQLLQKEMMT